MMLCWHCENSLREQTTDTLTGLARRNVIDWVIDTALLNLQLGRDRELSMAELCWWAVYAGAADAITETMAQRGLSCLKSRSSRYIKKATSGLQYRPAVFCRRNYQLQPQCSSADIAKMPALQEQPKVLALAADPESPESFMLKPKRRRWVNQTYTDWVKRQPCECCRPSR
jgi:hypothetical protein